MRIASASGKWVDGSDSTNHLEVFHVFGQNCRNIFLPHHGRYLAVEIALPGNAAQNAEIQREFDADGCQW